MPTPTTRLPLASAQGVNTRGYKAGKVVKLKASEGIKNPKMQVVLSENVTATTGQVGVV